MTRAAPFAAALAAVALGATCSHANRPCAKPRPFVGRAPTRAPADAPTIAAVEATGARYQVCSGGTKYRIDRIGARTLTDGELQDMKRALYSSTPGREQAGTGGVGCPPAKPDPGIILRIRENTATPAMVAERVAALAARAGGDPTVRVQVEIQSAPGPRCAPDDPACGPVPYQGVCLERTDYDPRGKREIVRARSGRGPCGYDGECRIAGCGNECVPASAVDRAGTCELYAGWDNVYCGCLEQKCVWFTTTR